MRARLGFVPRGVRRDAAADLTARKLGELREIAARWHIARDFFVRRLSGTKDLVAVALRPRSLRERQRREGWAPTALAVHYHQTAFLSAAAEVKRSWLVTLGRIRWRAGRRGDLTDDQKRWIRLVTRRFELTQRCIEGEAVTVNEDWAKRLDQARECRRLRRLILRAHTRSRPARRRDWFIVDGRLYRPFLRQGDRHYRGAWVSLTGVEKFRRIRIPLMGRTHEHLTPHAGLKEGRDLRVEIGGRVVFRTMEHVPLTDRDRDAVAGIDKGHNTLLTASFGDPASALSYGVGAGERVSAASIHAEESQRLRRRLVAYERSLRNSAAAKAKRIRRNNLRGRRRARVSRQVSRELRDIVNEALNRLFLENPRLRLLHVEGLDFVGSRRGHAFNRRLRRWLKGFLQRRLAYKAELNSVELNVVNAAYTSQTCTRCWFTSSRNRRAERFECGSCGYTGSADAMAATNVLRRGSDPAIARFMPSGAVKRILDERWRSALTGGAWGSNGPAPGDDVTREIPGAGAANNCRGQSTGTGLELPSEQSTCIGLERPSSASLATAASSTRLMSPGT